MDKKAKDTAGANGKWVETAANSGKRYTQIPKLGVATKSGRRPLKVKYIHGPE